MKKALILLPSLALLPVGSAHAAVFVYEGFQYGDVGASLQGQPDGTGGDVDATGLDGTWTDAVLNQEMFIKSGSLNFSNLPTSGNHIGFQSNQSNDIFNRTLSATATTTITTLGSNRQSIYFSFLFEKLQDNFGADHEGLALMNDVLSSSRWDSGNAGTVGTHGFAVAAVDGSNLQAVAYDGTTGTQVVGTNTLPITVVNGGSNTSTSNQAVSFIVGEISFNTGTDGADVFTLYNAADDGSLDAGDLTVIDTIEADVDESLLSTLNLTRQVNVNYDEVRIGSTLESVISDAPIPEPSSAGLLALASLGLLRRRR